MSDEVTVAILVMLGTIVAAILGVAGRAIINRRNGNPRSLHELAAVIRDEGEKTRKVISDGLKDVRDKQDTIGQDIAVIKDRGKS